MVNHSAPDTSPDQHPQRQAYSVEEFARICGVSRTSAYSAVKRGEVPHVRIGRRVVIPRRALERLLDGLSAPQP